MEDYLTLIETIIALLIIIAIGCIPLILGFISVKSFINHDYYNGAVYCYYAVGADFVLTAIRKVIEKN